MILRRFFVPDTPAGYRPGALLARIAAHDMPQLECGGVVGSEGVIRRGAHQIEVRERIRRDFLQHTSIAVFALGENDGSALSTAHHTGNIRRNGVRFEGDPVLSSRLNCPDVADALLPLDFTRFEVSGTPAAYRIEIETYGAAEVVLQLPRMRRYVPLGTEQSKHLFAAFDAVSSALNCDAPLEGAHS